MSGEPRISLRRPTEEDWQRIFELANAAVDHIAEAPLQSEWLGCRRAFNGIQSHFVAERDGEVVGYTAVERATEDPEATFRLFVVVSWNTSMDVTDLLFERAVDELERLGARHAWLREYASDQPLIAYFRSKGFDIREEYEHDGQLLVTLAKDLGGSDLAV